MKKRNVTFFLALGISYLAFVSYKTGPANNGYDCTGAETGLGNPTGCAGAGCHGNTATTGITLAVEVDTVGGTPVTQYKPGVTYTIKISGTNTTANILPKYGFQAAVIKGSAAVQTPVNAGTLQQAGLPAGVAYRSASPGNYVCNIVEHSSPLNPTTGTGGNGTTYVQSFTWTAPAAGTGTVSVWAVLNAVNNDLTNSSADKWNTNHISLTEMVAPAAPPVALFSVSPNDTICAGTPLSFTDQSYNTPTSWSWTFTGANTPTSTSQNPTNIIYNVAGTYTVKLTATNGSGSDTETHVIKVNALPSTTVTVAGANLSVPNTFASYQWYRNAALINGATNNTYTAASNGLYFVKVTNASGCVNNSDTANITTLAVGNIANSKDISLYPNPNEGIFTLRGMTGMNENTATIEISDVTGRIIKTEKLKLDNGAFEQLVKLDNSLAKAFYIVKFATASQRYVIPFEKK
ncbi:MAG: T9SS type A sorting domain-containing protein [Bacteroidetes bacterium]|nr:T9SS type A sorting domain-containing protein [Bacteroidota bacterium]